MGTREGIAEKYPAKHFDPKAPMPMLFTIQGDKDSAAFSTTKLEMPFLVVTGEKASGRFLIDQTKPVETNVTGTVVAVRVIC